MRENFIQTKGEQFFLNEKPILLRGWALGSWMNFEHFMMGLPGTNSMILDAFSEVYGEERKEEWLDAMLEHIVSELIVRQRAVCHLHDKRMLQIPRPDLLRTRPNDFG